MITHKTLAGGRWFELTTVEQFANIGVDIERTIQWKNRGDLEASKNAFWRALELIDLTIADPKSKGGPRRELVRTREVLIDHFVYDNSYKTTDELWQKYFFNFNYMAALRRGK